MIATNLFGRGVDFERVNVVINYDMPDDEDTYLHRVGRAGRFGTKGLAISFVTTPEDKEILEKVRSKFVVPLPELPNSIDSSTYSMSPDCCVFDIFSVCVSLLALNSLIKSNLLVRSSI